MPPDRVHSNGSVNLAGVQWDVAVEFGVLKESFAAGRSAAFDAIIAGPARCVDQGPGDAPVGLHLC